MSSTCPLAVNSPEKLPAVKWQALKNRLKWIKRIIIKCVGQQLLTHNSFQYFWKNGRLQTVNNRGSFKANSWFNSVICPRLFGLLCGRLGLAQNLCPCGPSTLQACWLHMQKSKSDPCYCAVLLAVRRLPLCSAAHMLNVSMFTWSQLCVCASLQLFMSTQKSDQDFNASKAIIKTEVAVTQLILCTEYIYIRFISNIQVAMFPVLLYLLVHICPYCC